MATETLVYINHAWMTHYRGPKGDKAEGNFGFLKTNDIAHASWSFESSRGKVYGYVPHSAEIKISRLGAQRGDATVELGNVETVDLIGHATPSPNSGGAK